MKAHSPDPKRQDGKWHGLRQHSQQVCQRAVSFCRGNLACLEEIVRHTARAHDMGKAASVWQAYVEHRHAKIPVPWVPHADSAAYFFHEVMGKSTDVGFTLAALSVLCHHGGFEDGQAHTVLNALVQKATKEDKARHQEAVNFYKYIFAEKPQIILSPQIKAMLRDPIRYLLCLHMLHSMLIDADCIDTHIWYENDYVPYNVDRAEIMDTFETYMQKLEGQASGTLQDLRSSLRRELVSKAQLPPGVYSMTMPTGSGKTLGALSYGLHHAQIHNKDRIIVVAPYISILQQNAKVCRDALGSHNVYEHHSGETQHYNRLTSTTWDRFCILTSNVQFFESLFSSRNNRIRKSHRIANSVIILDEVQSIPTHLLDVTLRALKVLVEDWGCTVVFCTATQPAFTQSTFSSSPLLDIPELISDPQVPFQALRRVQYHYDATKKTYADIAAEIEPLPQSLCILNTVLDAQRITQELPHALHLSSHMTGRHKVRVLDEVRMRLATGKPCTLVSTQVVEAGADLDFPTLYRAFGPLDRIIQAAGRCNREGLMALLGQVFIFELEGGDGRLPPGTYTEYVLETRRLLTRYGVDEFLERLHDPEFVKNFYSAIFNAADTDKSKILRLLREEKWRTADFAYQFLEDPTIDVLVMPNITDPDYAKIPEWIQEPHRHRRDLQPHIVSLFKSRYEKLANRGWITQETVTKTYKYKTFSETIRILHKDGYDPRMGVLLT